MSAAQRCILVAGAGSWGTALAMQLARQGHRVRLWERDADQVRRINAEGVNARYLPDIPLPEGIEAFNDMTEAVNGSELALIVTPSHGFTETVESLHKLWPELPGLAWGCKGFEPGSGSLLHEVAARILGPDVPLAVVTGPSFAREVALDQPTAVTVAATSEAFGAEWANLLHGPTFRAYYSADVVGAELGGALKNVLAVACGISDGMGLGDNTRAALITRGLAEMMRLGKALGADPMTLMGLAGVGDLVLTCAGDQSRNRRLGLALGRGQSAEQAVAEIGQVVEAMQTTREAMQLARQHQVDMPITEQVFGILFEGSSPAEGVAALMNRAVKPEIR